MLKCFICKCPFGTCQTLISHLRLNHSFYPTTKFKLFCAQDGCRRQFSTYAGLRKHLNTVHDRECSDNAALSTESRQGTLNENPFLTNETARTDQIQMDFGPFENNETNLNKINTDDICTSIIGKLQSSGIPNNTVSAIVNDLEEFTNELHSQIKQEILSVVPEDNAVRNALEQSLEKFDNPFSDLNSETKRTKYLNTKWGVVEPQEIILGNRFDMRRNKTTGTYSQVPVRDTFIYVPILDTLKFMCRNSEICKLLTQTDNKNTYDDFRDGSYFKAHPLFSKQKIALQIQIYYDDFETANPLGSKRGIHKVGALYFVLRNLPPRFNSAVMNIHLVALFHSDDVKTYGFDSILKPLINDIKTLETEGLDLPFSTDKIYGTICQITGDNLGMHSILGFTESFSGSHFCRLCLINKDDAQKVYTEDSPKMVMREKHFYEMQCQELESNPSKLSVFGLKRNSVLNSLQYFHVSCNFSLDIMHDILEGVAQYEMKLLFEYLAENFISKLDLLSRIYAFDYGYLERKNRPTRINLESSGNSIGLNSIQSLCLVRNIPLLFGDLVPEENEHWTLLLLLLQIINIVFSPSLTMGMTVHLKHLIMEHHSLFKRLYPHKNLIPKHHFMVHYPSCIRKIGPLIHQWSMRCEAKHKVFKNTIKNFKNITKSLAKKHQLLIAGHWDTLPANKVEYGPLKSISLDKDDDDGDDFADFHNVDPKDMFSANWVKISGTEYRTGLIVCSEFKEELPVFCKISKILVINSVIYFIADKLMVDHFSEHFHAYEVCESNERNVVKADSLVIYRPFDLQMAYDSDDLYIVPLFSL